METFISALSYPHFVLRDGGCNSGPVVLGARIHCLELYRIGGVSDINVSQSQSIIIPLNGVVRNRLHCLTQHIILLLIRSCVQISDCVYIRSLSGRTLSLLPATPPTSAATARRCREPPSWTSLPVARCQPRPRSCCQNGTPSPRKQPWLLSTS